MNATKLAVTGTKLLAGAVVAGQMLTFSTQANATAFAYSALEVTSFLMNNQFGGFNSFEFTSQQVSATVNGVTLESPTVLTSTTAGVGVNQLQIVNGALGIAADNSYFGANRPTLLTPANNYAVADSHMTNVTILGGAGGNFGTQAGAQLSGGGDGSAQTGTANSMAWTFNVSQAELDAAGGTISLSWALDFVRQNRVQTTLAKETARGTLSLRVNLIQDGETIDSTSHIQSTRSISANASPASAGPVGEESGSLGDAFQITEIGDYTFNIEFDSSVRVDSVPEPGALGLLGLGLIGLGAAYRRKRAA